LVDAGSRFGQFNGLFVGGERHDARSPPGSNSGVRDAECEATLTSQFRQNATSFGLVGVPARLDRRSDRPKLLLMASARATVTLQESSDGGVYVLVQTREPLGPYKLLGRQWQPEQYLNRQVDPGSVQLMCSLEVDSGLWLPQLRASTPFWSVDRYLDITAQSAERWLLERMIAQEDFEVVWANEGIRARRPVHERTRKLLQETFAGFSELDAATWKEAVAESEWRGSENWRPGPRPGKPRRRTARPTTDVELRYFAMRTGALPREGAARVANFKLPRGRRFGGFWCSDEAVDEAIALASGLASEFSGTGLWPMLWAYPEEPTGYMSGLGDLEWIEGVQVTTLLEREWAAHPPRTEWVAPLGPAFPGVASPIDRDVGMHFDPFETLKAHRLGTRESLSARLLIVPCNRPADALTAPLRARRRGRALRRRAQGGCGTTWCAC
jgi:hypothetical protein